MEVIATNPNCLILGKQYLLLFYYSNLALYCIFLTVSYSFSYSATLWSTPFRAFWFEKFCYNHITMDCNDYGVRTIPMIRDSHPGKRCSSLTSGTAAAGIAINTSTMWLITYLSTSWSHSLLVFIPFQVYIVSIIDRTIISVASTLISRAHAVPTIGTIVRPTWRKNCCVADLLCVVVRH